MTKDHFVIIATRAVQFSKNEQVLVEVSLILRTAEKAINKFHFNFDEESTAYQYLTVERSNVQTRPMEGPDFVPSINSIVKILDNAILVSYRANFDYSLLQEKLGTMGHRLKCPFICLTVLAQKKIKSLNATGLRDICNYFSIPSPDLEDLDALAITTDNLFDRLVCDNFLVQISRMLPKLTDVRPIKSNTIDVGKLQQKPGVYYFNDNSETILYIGKAVRLLDRVRSHLSDKNKGAQLLSEIY